jgi:hydrogenase-4 component F
MHAFHSKHISDIRNVLVRMPKSGLLWLAGAVAITGAPPFGLFPSELTILRAGLMGPNIWAALVMLILLIVIFVGFLNHFRAMYFGPSENVTVTTAHALKTKPLARWCLVPMWMALVPLLLLGLWWPQAFSNYFAAIAVQLSSAGASP